MTGHPIFVQRLPHAEGLPLPSYATDGSAGMDLIAAIGSPVSIFVGRRVVIPTGLQVALPLGYEMQIRSRSGLAMKQGISVCQGVGTIDQDYRGEIKVLLINHGDTIYVVNRGDRIAQAVLAPVVRASLYEVTSLEQTARGSGGFGSTGAAAE